MTLNAKEKQLIEEEERYLEEVITKLGIQNRETSYKLAKERNRARELTSELVNARQAEDKQLIASDEAVSHALSSKKATDLDINNNLLESPYFARLLLEEEVNRKKVKREYKLGKFSNADCRIIDWRNSPIAKIYYEYKEGEEFFEEVQGRDREGIVLDKISVDIKKAKLLSFKRKEGRFTKVGDTWEAHSGSLKGGTKGQLPDVLSLISSEQFSLITQSVDTAVLLQGVAGSGKTTVALHRLSWLLAQKEADSKANNSIIIAESPALSQYIQNSLEALELTEVKVNNFSNFCNPLFKEKLANCFYSDGEIRRPKNNCPQSSIRLLNSVVLLDILEEQNIDKNLSPYQIIIGILNDANQIIEKDKTRLIDKDLINSTSNLLKTYDFENTIDKEIEPILYRIIQIQKPELNKIYDQIVVDEVQEASSVKLACFLNSVENTSSLTLVGDTAQAFQNEQSFQGWDELQSRLTTKESNTHHITLNVSHRSTLQIMKLADYVQQRQIVKEGRNGRVPIHFIQKNEESALKACIDWLKIALDKYPTHLTLIIAPNPNEARVLDGFLKPTFGSQVRLELSSNFNFEEGLVISTIKQVRGLEFTNVLLWNVNSRNYPNHPAVRNALYVAITRAEENLCLINYGRTSCLLPNTGNKLTRVLIEQEDD